MLATLRQRNFALLWVGGLISFTGDWMLLTALPYYVYQRTGSTLATATMTVVSILPSVLLSSLAGVFVDRWNRKRILVVSNLLQMLTVLFLLFVGRSALFWVVYAVALAQSAISTFTIPAENALLLRLVDQHHLLSANALNSLNNNLARLIGPPLGGVLLAVLGLEVVVLFDSLSFGCAAACIALITIPATPINREPQQATLKTITMMAGHWVVFWREWLEGLTTIRKDRFIITLMVVLGITTFGGTMFDPLYPAFAKDILRAGAMGFGWLLTAQAVGGILPWWRCDWTLGDGPTNSAYLSLGQHDHWLHAAASIQCSMAFACAPHRLSDWAGTSGRRCSLANIAPTTCRRPTQRPCFRSYGHNWGVAQYAWWRSNWATWYNVRYCSIAEHCC